MNGTMITLVAIIDCHASHNVRLENVKPEEKGYIKRFLKKQGYQVVEREPKPAEPTCDNCANMAIRRNRSGENYRRCMLFGQPIPDNEQSPTCDYHSAVSNFERMMTEAARRNKKGGRK